MYIPAHFAEIRLEALTDLIRRHPFATFVTAEAGMADAEHIPLVLRSGGASGTLVGHVARANPVWKRAPTGTDVLLIFQGPDHYISPRWYPSKQEHGKVVPTWNYAVVHVRGVVTWKKEIEWFRAHLDELTGEHEAGAMSPWRMSDAPDDYLQGMMRGIVGLEVEVRELEGKWKISQNRAAKDIHGVVEGLDSLGTDRAAEMLKMVRSVGGAGDA